MKDVILCGDVLEKLKELSDESVDCIVTSPPYYGLRDYGTAKWEGGDPNCDHKGKPLAHQTSIHQRTQPQCNNQPDERTFEIYKDICKKCGAKRIDQQLGLEPTLNEYLDKMLLITAELKRVLKKTGTMWWNHGDSYNSHSTGNGGVGGLEGQRKNKQDNRANAHRKFQYPDKCLMLQAHRLAIRMVDEQGWILRNQIIWHKPNVMPSSVKDRFTVDFEPIFFFSKSKKYWFEQQFEDRVSSNSWNESFNMRVRDVGRSKKASHQYKATDDEIRKYTEKKKMGGGGTGFKNHSEDYRPDGTLIGIPGKRGMRSVWKIPTRSFKEAHFATFPETLIKTPIKAGCPEFICKKCGKSREKIIERGELISYEKKVLGYTDCGCNAGFEGGVVLDPFMGACTTALVAKKLGRRYIGIELNPDYIKICEDRLKPLLAQPSLLT